MLNEFRKNYSLVRILLILLIIAVGGYVLSLAWVIISKFLDLFVILLSAWLLSLILEPIVTSIQSLLKISKLIATITTYILVSALVIIISIVYLPLVTAQIVTLINILPDYLATAPPSMVNFTKSLSDQIGNSILLIPSVAQFLFSAFITLILSFYFIVDQEKIHQEFFNITPKHWHGALLFTQKVINDTFISFLRVQLFFGVASGILTWLVLMIFNINYAPSIAFISGAFAFIPLVGPLFALIPPVLVALIADPVKAGMIGAILLIIQQIIFNVIGPKLFGSAFKLHPALILVSFLVGLQFAGSLGAMFAIPVLGISAVMIRRFGSYFLKITDEATKEMVQ